MLSYTILTAALDRVVSRNRSERGASLLEYTFLLAFVVAVTIGSVMYFGGTLNGSLAHSGSAVNNVVSNGS